MTVPQTRNAINIRSCCFPFGFGTASPVPWVLGFYLRNLSLIKCQVGPSAISPTLVLLVSKFDGGSCNQKTTFPEQGPGILVEGPRALKGFVTGL